MNYTVCDLGCQSPTGGHCPGVEASFGFCSGIAEGALSHHHGVIGVVAFLSSVQGELLSCHRRVDVYEATLVLFFCWPCGFGICPLDLAATGPDHAAL